jgi:hypothetical protein
MITRPSTDQIILDCRRELLEVLGPEITSDAGKVSVQMIENVLRNVATRAAHEIAWMREETTALEQFARDTLAILPGSSSGPSSLAAALAALEASPRDSLHLSDVSTVYSLAGEAFSCSIEAAMSGGDQALTERGIALLAARNATEQEIKGEWGFVGRG